MILVNVSSTGRTRTEGWVDWVGRWRDALGRVDASWDHGVALVLAWLSLCSRGGLLEANYNPVLVPCQGALAGETAQCFDHPVVHDLLLSFASPEDAIRAYQGLVRSNDEAWRRLQARDPSWVFYVLPYTSPFARPVRSAVELLYGREVSWVVAITGLERA